MRGFSAAASTTAGLCLLLPLLISGVRAAPSNANETAATAAPAAAASSNVEQPAGVAAPATTQQQQQNTNSALHHLAAPLSSHYKHRPDVKHIRMRDLYEYGLDVRGT